jgi:hypothetical protein
LFVDKVGKTKKVSVLSVTRKAFFSQSIIGILIIIPMPAVTAQETPHLAFLSMEDYVA